MRIRIRIEQPAPAPEVVLAAIRLEVDAATFVAWLDNVPYSPIV